MKIAIIGGGWYGCHLALSLKKAGYQTIIFEKNNDIFSQISGKFGIRLHLGPHYPRSTATRVTCRENFEKFKKQYPNLVVDHEYSIYALGDFDADNQPPKVSVSEFNAVCKESENSQEIDIKKWGYNHLITAWTMKEPSIVVGTRLREEFKKYLKEAKIPLICNFIVKKIEEKNSKFLVSSDEHTEEFDLVINASSYQSLVPNDPFPFDMGVVYQPCLALTYTDLTPGERPFSFIVMDGWFPCLMPSITQQPYNNEYILTNGKWTIMGSFQNVKEASQLLESLNDKFIEEKIRPSCEQEMAKFWPVFSTRFRYTGWKGSVLAKLKTDSEFRSAVIFEKDKIIHTIPGKVSNIFDAEREVFSLINNINIIENKEYRYVHSGFKFKAH